MNGNKIKSKPIDFIKRTVRIGLIAMNDGFICLPVKKNEVIFESFNGNDVNDNPAAVYFEWVNRNPQYADQAYFAVKPRRYKELHAKYPNVKLLKRFHPRWVLHMARAEFWVFNSRFPKWWKKNKQTTYIQTWHGTPLKKLGIDIKNVEIPGTSTEQYHEDFAQEARRWQYLIMPNQYSEDIFNHAFAFQNTPLRIGYPRNDVLYKKNDKKDINDLKEKLIGNNKQKAILYAPTWRDDDFQKKGVYNFKLPFSLKKFFDSVGPDYVLIIRPHYLVKDNIDITGFEDRVKIKPDADISELYLISDLLITDYSSVMFDYANLKRPMLFYAYDLNHYRDELRGFYFDYEKELPGPLVESENDFYEALSQFAKNGNFPKYDDKMKAFNKKFCGWEHGNAAEKAVDVMEEKNG